MKKVNKTKKTTNNKKSTAMKPKTKKISKPTAKTATKKSAPKASASAATKKPAAKAKRTSTKKTIAKTSANSNKQVQAQQSGLVTVEIRVHQDAKGGHPHIMVDTVNDKNVSVGTTHDKYKGKGHKNIPLQVNPLGTNEQTYMRKQGTVDDKKNYSSTANAGKMTASDNAKAKQIGEKAKQKHLSQQKPKK